MPLDKSGSKASVGNNIKTEMSAGKPRKQAIAIALDTQRRSVSRGVVMKKGEGKKHEAKETPAQERAEVKAGKDLYARGGIVKHPAGRFMGSKAHARPKGFK